MYLIDVPPPTISGKLHMGHIFSYSQMDFVARYQKIIQGKHLLYPFCYDNTGIPTERLAQEAGITNKWHILDHSEAVSKEYEKLFMDMGYAMSFNKPKYSTFSNLATDVTHASFKDLKAKGLLYEDERDSLWCPKTETWVSQSEVDENGKYERSGYKVEVRKQHGFFVKVVEHLDRIKKAVNEIEWKPAHYKTRLLDWLDGYKYDWSISRERKYGVKMEGQDNLVYDTWFISSLTPQIAYSAMIDRPTLEFPVFDARFQAHDIINTWALYTIIKSVYHSDHIPWKRIVISGHALTGEGGKMSKSKGKNVPPQELLATWGADPIRFWAGHTQPGSDAKIDLDVIAKGKKLINKIKNARRWVAIKGRAGFHQHFMESWGAVRWHIIKEMDDCNWANALHELVTFFWGTYCDKFITEAKTLECGETMYDIMYDMLNYFEVFLPNVKTLTKPEPVQ